MEYTPSFRGVGCPEQLVMATHNISELSVGDELTVLKDCVEHPDLTLEPAGTKQCGWDNRSQQDRYSRVEIVKTA